MNSELSRKPSGRNLRHCPGIFLQGLKKPNEKSQLILESRLEPLTKQTQGVRFAHFAAMFDLLAELEWLQEDTEIQLNVTVLSHSCTDPLIRKVHVPAAQNVLVLLSSHYWARR